MRFFTLSMSCVVFACVLLLSTSCATSTNDGLVRIPMERMESGLEKLFRHGADLELVEGLYNMNMKKSQASQQVWENGQLIRTHDTLNLFKYFDTQYFANISIGNPRRLFKMVLDTTWAYSWVPSKDCPKYIMACDFHHKYDHSQSSGYVKDGRSFNVSKAFSGYMSRDDFHVGDYNATNQGFAELTKIPFIFTLHNTDGSIGLGLKALSPMTVPFFDNFAEQNHMQRIFSCYIERYSNKSDDPFFYLGGVDYNRNRSEFTSVNLTSPYFWQFNMTKVSVVQGRLRQDYCVNGCSAIADTSTNTIIGPVKEVKAINHLIGAKNILFANRYMISCQKIHTGPNVTFTISNKEFQIEPKDYIQKLSLLGIPMCISAFQPAGADNFPKNTWGLGGAFMFRFYTAFDIDNHKFMIADL